MTPSKALQLYETACASHKRADWRLACHAMAQVIRASQPGAVDPVREATVKPIRAPKDRTLLEFLSLRGVRDDGVQRGDLKAAGLDRWHTDKPFRRRIVRADGMSLEAAALSAFEAGYFPERSDAGPDDSATYEPVTVAELIDAMESELYGRRTRYPFSYGAANEPEFDAGAYEWAMQEEAA